MAQIEQSSRQDSLQKQNLPLKITLVEGVSHFGFTFALRFLVRDAHCRTGTFSPRIGRNGIQSPDIIPQFTKQGLDEAIGQV